MQAKLLSPVSSKQSKGTLWESLNKQINENHNQDMISDSAATIFQPNKDIIEENDKPIPIDMHS